MLGNGFRFFRHGTIQGGMHSFIADFFHIRKQGKTHNQYFSFDKNVYIYSDKTYIYIIFESRLELYIYASTYIHIYIHIYLYIYIDFYFIHIYIYIHTFIFVFVCVCVCIGDIFTLHQPPLLHPTLGPSTRPSVRRMGTKSATPRRSGADTVHATMWGWFSTRVFWGVPCHQPSTNKWVY